MGVGLLVQNTLIMWPTRHEILLESVRILGRYSCSVGSMGAARPIPSHNYRLLYEEGASLELCLKILLLGEG